MNLPPIRKSLMAVLMLIATVTLLLSLQNCQKLDLAARLKVNTGSIFNITSTSVSIKGELIFLGETEI